MVIGSQPTIVATWLASQPTVPDFSCGFQFHLSSGTRSRVLRVLCISWSNSPSIICPMVMTSSLVDCEIRTHRYWANKKRIVKQFFHPHQLRSLRLLALPNLVARTPQLVSRNL